MSPNLFESIDFLALSEGAGGEATEVIPKGLEFDLVHIFEDLKRHKGVDGGSVGAASGGDGFAKVLHRPCFEARFVGGEVGGRWDVGWGARDGATAEMVAVTTLAAASDERTVMCGGRGRWGLRDIFVVDASAHIEDQPIKAVKDPTDPSHLHGGGAFGRRGDAANPRDDRQEVFFRKPVEVLDGHEQDAFSCASDAVSQESEQLAVGVLAAEAAACDVG